MSKILYPKPSPKSKTAKNSLKNRLYHVKYTDPNNELDPEWRYYNSELAVKVGSWYHCKVLGFHSAATMYERDEIK